MAPGEPVTIYRQGKDTGKGRRKIFNTTLQMWAAGLYRNFCGGRRVANDRPPGEDGTDISRLRRRPRLEVTKVLARPNSTCRLQFDASLGFAG
jgi:hypothetical protein